MNVNVANRECVKGALCKELVGPDPQGQELDCNSAVYFENWEEAAGPYKQKETGEEILQKDTPRIRYGVAVLYPIGQLDAEIEAGDEQDGIAEDEQESDGRRFAENAQDSIEQISARNDRPDDDSSNQSDDSETDTDDDFTLASANEMRQSCMGVSFVAEVTNDCQLVVKASGGRYSAFNVHIASADKSVVWWRRSAATLRATFSGAQLLDSESDKVDPPTYEELEVHGLNLMVEAYSRPVEGNQKLRLITVALVNRTSNQTGSTDSNCLFQSHFSVWFEQEGSRLASILPYPEGRQTKLDEEEQSIALLYRNKKTFAVGHGCAADWRDPDVTERKSEIWATCLPDVEVPSITSDVTRKDGTPVEISMSLLAGLQPGKDGFTELEEAVSLYEQWIKDQKSAAENRFFARSCG